MLRKQLAYSILSVLPDGDCCTVSLRYTVRQAAFQALSQIQFRQLSDAAATTENIK